MNPAPFTLKQTPVPLRAIPLVRNVRHPSGLIPATGGALLDPASSGADLVLDFGTETVGVIELELESTRETSLVLYYGEDLPEALRSQDYQGGWYHLPQDPLTIPPGRNKVRNPGRRAFRYVRVHLEPEQPPLTVHHAQALLVHYPVAREGFFSSSDPELNRIWEISRHTTRLCMQQFYEDGVKRDGLLWTGDYRIAYLCNSMLFGDRDLAAHSLRLIAASQMDNGRIPACAARAGAHQHPWNIPYMPCVPHVLAEGVLVNYETDFIGSLREYEAYTGDLDLVRELWPVTVRLLKQLMQDDIDRISPHWGSSLAFLTDQHPDRPGGAHSALAAMYLMAFTDAERLATRLGDISMATQCQASAAKTLSLCGEYFSVQDGFYHDEKTPGRASMSANALMVRAGASTPDTGRAMLKILLDSAGVRWPVGAYATFWMLQGLYKAGMKTEALAQIRRYWGVMLRNNATSCWEGVNPDLAGVEPNEGAAISQCHGWMAGPAYFFPAHILGIQPAAPGFSQVRITPDLTGLTYAQGTIPTPLGDIEISLEQEKGRELKGKVILPKGMQAIDSPWLSKMGC